MALDLVALNLETEEEDIHHGRGCIRVHLEAGCRVPSLFLVPMAEIYHSGGAEAKDLLWRGGSKPRASGNMYRLMGELVFGDGGRRYYRLNGPEGLRMWKTPLGGRRLLARVTPQRTRERPRQISKLFGESLYIEQSSEPPSFSSFSFFPCRVISYKSPSP